jgi:hypothetical protein
LRIYQTPDELIDQELPIGKRARLYPVINDAFNFFNDFLLEHDSLFQSEFFKNTKGHLLSYIVCRHFEPDMVSPNFPFYYYAEKVNNFGYKNGILKSGNVIINISRARQPNGLPNKSFHRLKKCAQNDFKSINLFFDVNHKNRLFLNNEPYCCFLTYEVVSDQLETVNLIVPDQKMNSVLKNIDLKSEYAFYEPEKEIIDVAEKEKKITALKEEILAKVKFRDA